jgi:truncated hemoglobin YjbI
MATPREPQPTLYERLGGVYSIAVAVDDTMRDPHRQLHITPGEWDAFMGDFQQTLDKVEVPAAEQAELKAIVQGTYGDIVAGASPDRAPA